MASKKQRLLQLQGDWTASELSIHFKPGVKSDALLNTTSKAGAFVRSAWDKELINLQEQVMAFFLNSRNKVIGYRVICTGTRTGCLIDIQLIVSLALHSLASSVILAHNHPSGNVTPSIADIETTKQIKAALNLIDVKLYDHFIITEYGWSSMYMQGCL